MKLSVKKLRRSATVIGGTFLGLGLAAALATPALACRPIIEHSNVCAHADGTWEITYTVTAEDAGVGGEISEVLKTPNDSPLTNIQKDASIPANGKLVGVQTLKATDEQASIDVSATFHLAHQDVFSHAKSGWIYKTSELCKGETTTPPPTSTTSPAPTATTTPPDVPQTQPNLVYNETCTILTVGVTVPKDWKQSETGVFKPSVGDTKTVTAKPGETKTVDFPASKGLTVTGSLKSSPKDTAKITYEAPKDCSSPAATPSTSQAALAITGSSSTPIAGGAVALVLLGGGAFFLARRRKMKFTA
ncbi:LAETG motif-containing sortase-dependent surface protein [Actinoplanes sp. NPDC051411]|uniref:LAETG motif-containing sortase-dependent surface protein n=1 Tax=Actinoplanes sp. NPDC051411 TaxID=3155522 RepID=UPI00342560B1